MKIFFLIIFSSLLFGISMNVVGAASYTGSWYNITLSGSTWQYTQATDTTENDEYSNDSQTRIVQVFAPASAIYAVVRK